MGGDSNDVDIAPIVIGQVELFLVVLCGKPTIYDHSSILILAP